MSTQAGDAKVRVRVRFAGFEAIEAVTDDEQLSRGACRVCVTKNPNPELAIDAGTPMLVPRAAIVVEND